MAPRHSIVVRLTHWSTTVSFIGLLVSGIAILLAHPRLYWGETGAVGMPSLVDLPLPFVLSGQSGWGRSLHFLSAWILVPTAFAYGSFGFATGHFREHLLPAGADLSWTSLSHSIADHLRMKPVLHGDRDSYNVLQRLAYAAVVFALFPLMIWTGFAMSPALVSVWPPLVTALGGQQSARTIHFVAAVLLALFAVVHVTMVSATGFVDRMRSMTVDGRSTR
jgi:thiosulfate reductase cytochrome b subunit